MSDQPGLRKRIEIESERIASQHQGLSAFREELANAIAQTSSGVAPVAFDRYQDALEAHFSMEEMHYFPALHGLHPETDGVLADLVREHKAFRVQLERLRRLVYSASFEAARERLDDLSQGLAEHESTEEHLLSRIGELPTD